MKGRKGTLYKCIRYYTKHNLILHERPTYFQNNNRESFFFKLIYHFKKYVLQDNCFLLHIFLFFKTKHYL